MAAHLTMGEQKKIKELYIDNPLLWSSEDLSHLIGLYWLKAQIKKKYFYFPKIQIPKKIFLLNIGATFVWK